MIDVAESKDAGDFNDEDAYSPDTDNFDGRKVRIPCPHCGRVTAALLSPLTEWIDGGWRWVGCDHREPYGTFRTRCSSTRGCGQPFTFTTYTAQ